MTTAPLDMRAELLTFGEGMPGFPGQQRFSVLQPGLEPFMTLEPTEAGPTFVVVPPSAVLDDYDVPVDNDTAAALGIVEPDDAYMLAIVAVVPTRPATPSTCSARSSSTGTPAERARSCSSTASTRCATRSGSDLLVGGLVLGRLVFGSACRLRRPAAAPPRAPSAGLPCDAAARLASWTASKTSLRCTWTDRGASTRCAPSRRGSRAR